MALKFPLLFGIGTISVIFVAVSKQPFRKTLVATTATISGIFLKRVLIPIGGMPFGLRALPL